MRRKESKTSGIEPYIIDTICLNYSQKESLSYLEEKGYKIGPATYYRLQKEIKESTQQRLNLISCQEFISQHMERIDQLRTINKEMWTNYKLEKNPSKKVQILEAIEANQDFLARYYDSTRWVLEQTANSRYRKQEQKQQEEQH